MSPGNDASPSPGPSPLQTGEIPLFLSDALLRHLQSLSSPSGAQLPQLPRSTEGGSIRYPTPEPSPAPRGSGPSRPRTAPCGLRGSPAPLPGGHRHRSAVLCGRGHPYQRRSEVFSQI